MPESKIYPKGMFFDKPHEKAPTFVRGKISIKVDEFIPFIQEHRNEKGYVNFQILKGTKEDPEKSYLVLDTWKPTKQGEYGQP